MTHPSHRTPLTAVLAANNCYTFNGNDCTTCTQCVPGYELTYYNATSHSQICIVSGVAVMVDCM